MMPRPSAGASSASDVPARLRPHLARITSFLIVFAVGYSVGLLSSYTRPSQTTIVRPHAAHLTDASSTVPAPNATAAGVAAAATTASYPRSPPHDLFRFREECGEPVPSDAVVPTLLEKLFDGESPYAGFPTPQTAALLHELKNNKGSNKCQHVFKRKEDAVLFEITRV
ncbi:hypothetical protein GQ55_2G324200 [Panicum hallii var. hallii]|uniref:Uncharacterized protein n=1 Tax=Panicum hallii var. hallii TaxID=1504633 RepID=A0A2T7EUR9_9POAL|nr:hypothetical protein GQ55_2G324200 [Panicum hallii var. hallii]